MAFDEIQQLHSVIESSKQFLIVFNAKNNTDAVCSALALKSYLEKQGKQADIVSPGFKAPKNLEFLKGLDQIKPEITNLQKFIIKVDVSKIKLDTLSYDVTDGWLSIFLTPKTGIISKNELRTSESTFKYDAIITISSQDLESLGDLFFANTDLFYAVPIINFDHHPANEHFGQLNFVEITATSTSEVTYKIMEKLGEAYIDEEIATALLAGMISHTHSFKSPSVTPFTLNLASKLIDIGADREKIIKSLYLAKPISSLKLWGQALTHLENDPTTGLVWTSLTREDFSRAGAGPEDLNGLSEDLIANSPEAKLILILFEEPTLPGKIRGVLHADKQFDAKILLAPFGAEGNRKSATFVVEGRTLKEVEKEIIENIRKQTMA